MGDEKEKIKIKARVFGLFAKVEVDVEVGGGRPAQEDQAEPEQEQEPAQDMVTRREMDKNMGYMGASMGGTLLGYMAFTQGAHFLLKPGANDEVGGGVLLALGVVLFGVAIWSARRLPKSVKRARA